jgi:hypothetical protein
MKSVVFPLVQYNCQVAGQRRPTRGTVRLPTENRNQSSILKAAHGPQNLPRPLRQPAMSDSAPTPAQDTATPSIDTQQLQQPPPPQSLVQVQDPQLHAQLHQNAQQTISDAPRKCEFSFLFFFLSFISPPRSVQLNLFPPFFGLKPPAKAPAVRRACTSCHSGKTRCSEILPCQVRIYCICTSVSHMSYPSELPQAWSWCHMCLSRSRGPS